MTTQRASEPLLCQMGWHDPEPLARWNDGYYFTRCRRCRRDLVRTLYGRWQVPRGFRVVWQAQPPKTRAPAQIVRERPGGIAARMRRSNAPSETELPIQEVLRHLHEQEEKRHADTGLVEEPDEQPQQAIADPATAAAIVPAEEAAEVDLEPASQHLGEAERAGESEEAGDINAESDGTLSDETPILEEPPVITQGEDQAEPEAGADSESVTEMDGPHGSDADGEAQAEAEVAEAEPESEADTEGEAEANPSVAVAPDESETEGGPTDARGSRIPDFMGNWPSTTDWEYFPTRRRPRPRIEAEPTPAPAAAGDADPEAAHADETQPQPEVASDASQSEAAVEEPVEVEPEYVPFEPVEEEPPRRFKPHFARLIGADGRLRLGPIVRAEGDEQPTLTPTALLLAISLPLLILIAALLLSRGPRVVERTVLPPVTTPAAPAAQPAFVTASALNCRSAPARQAAPVRRLARGALVGILARDGEWTSVAYRGEQCWVLSRYLAVERPA